ncbi:alpha/beta fold hydrolase [Phenylobacterium sp. CCH12-B4]|nr:alpha/beta hydrolase [Phenylobacterium sp. CCH12-B4]
MRHEPDIARGAAEDDLRRVRHRRLELDGHGVFYREAGPPDAPVLLLPHGYPCSSFEFRNYMPALADRWRLLAPDFPGSGLTDDPPGFQHDFSGYAHFLGRFADALGVKRFALYLHDFGTWIGLRLALQRSDQVAALIIQNGDIYEDALGPKYKGLLETLALPEAQQREAFSKAVSEEEFRVEFLNDVRPDLAERIPPDLWKLHAGFVTPARREILVRVLMGWKANVDWFPRYQAWLRERRPPTLIIWGPQDGYMPEASARAYLRDLPDAELHLLDGGHWLLETNLDEAVALTRNFLTRAFPAAP